MHGAVVELGLDVAFGLHREEAISVDDDAVGGGKALNLTLLVLGTEGKRQRLGNRAVQKRRIETVVDADRRQPQLATGAVGRVDARVLKEAAAGIAKQAGAAAGEHAVAQQIQDDRAVDFGAGVEELVKGGEQVAGRIEQRALG